MLHGGGSPALLMAVWLVQSCNQHGCSPESRNLNVRCPAYMLNEAGAPASRMAVLLMQSRNQRVAAEAVDLKRQLQQREDASSRLQAQTAALQAQVLPQASLPYKSLSLDYSKVHHPRGRAACFSPSPPQCATMPALANDM